jgi:hypothetical protein
MSDEELLSIPAVISLEEARQAIIKAARDAGSSDRPTADRGMRELSYYYSRGYAVPFFLPIVAAPANPAGLPMVAAPANPAGLPMVAAPANPAGLRVSFPNEDEIDTVDMEREDDNRTGRGRKIPTHKLKMDSRVQSNDPRDIDRSIWNESQVEQQLRGGSWSQPPWNGWHPIIGAGSSFASFHPWQSHPMGYMGSGHTDYFQRYAQDGDSGFFHLSGGIPHREFAWSPLYGGADPSVPRGLPVGISPFPPNCLDGDYEDRDEPDFADPQLSTIEPEKVPDPDLDPGELGVVSQSAEHQQRATYVPPYSQTYQRINEGNVLYEDPLKIPEYKGGFHKKDKLLKR